MFITDFIIIENFVKNVVSQFWNFSKIKNYWRKNTNKTMAKKNGRNITVDELAVMMKNSIDSQTKLMLNGFDKINDKIDKKIYKIASKEDVKNLNKKLDSLSEDLRKNNKLETRVAGIENVLNMPAIRK